MGLLVAVGAASPAGAAGPPDITAEAVLSDQSYTEIDSELAQYGVPRATREILIQKLENGQDWDSVSGAAPVHVETEKNAATREIITVDHFADGSIAVSTTSDLEAVKRAAEAAASSSTPIITPRAITGCSFTSNSYGGYWKGCKAERNWITMALGFHFDYSNLKDRGARIDNQYGIYKRAIQGYWDGDAFSNPNPATVRLTSHRYAEVGGISAQTTSWVQVRVAGNNATQTSSS